ncbi:MULTISPECIES: hypothetical protein [unclassified Modestobacter]|uniref:hypothetical protein n=1 Tax=unclassified Modestobacter TaxID=2643866 RepID=UPI0022AA79D5|nr:MULTISPECIES: hypothetical protein [unclassified Modestobacter]MCZ2824631.1 hypothetical protein [Modestobacter sp. VKM Ac-2981]MCZ2854866.1 hypothetical protein [Modestobacter sp. VKM Ac-2982]
MSAIAHVPGSAWAATHRFLVFALTMAFVAALVLVVALIARDSPAATPSAPYFYDTCAGAMPRSAC